MSGELRLENKGLPARGCPQTEYKNKYCYIELINRGIAKEHSAVGKGKCINHYKNNSEYVFVAVFTHTCY